MKKIVLSVTVFVLLITVQGYGFDGQYSRYEPRETVGDYILSFKGDLRLNRAEPLNPSGEKKHYYYTAPYAYGAALFFLLVLLWGVITIINRKKLLKQERKFRNLFELSQDGVLLRRLGAEVFYDCNQAMLEMLGHTDKEKFLKLGPKDIVFTKQPDGQIIDDLLEQANTIIKEKKKNRFEGLFKRKDGTPMYAEVVACLVDIDGEPTIQSVVRDMSNRKKMEDELRKLSSAVQWSSAAIIITDSDGNVEYINQKFTELSGYDLDEVVGLNPRFLKSGKQSERFYKDLWGTIGKGRPWHGTMLNKRKDGETYWVSSSISAVFGEDNEISHFVGVQDDITELKRMEQELVEAKESADHANRAKGDFLARMSHEIRTPMNAIIGMNHLALQTELNDQQRDYIEKAHGSAKSLLGILNDILDFSKIEAGKMEFEAIEFDLDEVFQTLSSVVALNVSKKKLDLLYMISPETPRYLVGDPLRLGQVLINLVNNAVKFTHQGEVVVSVKPQSEHEGCVTLLFSVQDTGIGMNEEQQKKLFQSFSQADGSITRKYGGSGLGLVICSRLVEMMGGEISAESKENEGTTFSFTAILKIAAGGSLEKVKLPGALEGIKILVVDDSGITRRTLSTALTQVGFDVETAESGEEAEKMVLTEKRDYELILMDWDMPGRNGIEVSKTILAHNDKIKIVIVTGYGQEEIAREAKEAGIHDFLIKPVPNKVLINCIKGCFGHEVEEISQTTTQGLSQQNNRSIWGAHVLLVEDNALNQQVAMELLASAKLRVTIAENGKVALEKLKEATFDIVLMDIQMPEMNGYEATMEIRKFNSKTPIVAMTASAMAGDKKRSIDAGMNDHITKPIDPDLLYKTLLKWIEPGERPVPSPLTQDIEENHQGKITVDGVDSELGLKHVGGNRSLYINLLAKFCDHHEDAPERIKEAYAKGEFELCKQIIHTVKGLSGSIGAGKLQEICANLEVKTQKKELNYNADEYLSFTTYMAEIIKSIRGTLALEEEVSIQQSGDSLQLKELLLELRPFVSARKPRQCMEIVEKLRQYRWSQQDENKVEELVVLIERYKYKDAQKILDELLDNK